MTAPFTKTELLDTGNAEAQEGLRRLCLELRGYRFQLPGVRPASWYTPEGQQIAGIMLPLLDHNLMAELRDLLTKEERKRFEYEVEKHFMVITNRLEVHAFDLINASPTIQGVCVLLVKGVVK